MLQRRQKVRRPSTAQIYLPRSIRQCQWLNCWAKPLSQHRAHVAGVESWPQYRSSLSARNLLLIHFRSHSTQETIYANASIFLPSLTRSTSSTCSFKHNKEMSIHSLELFRTVQVSLNWEHTSLSRLRESSYECGNRETVTPIWRSLLYWIVHKPVTLAASTEVHKVSEPVSRTECPPLAKTYDPSLDRITWIDDTIQSLQSSRRVSAFRLTSHFKASRRFNLAARWAGVSPSYATKQTKHLRLRWCRTLLSEAW
jgi:hypothetical protein